jgi:hypothetical protein
MSLLARSKPYRIPDPKTYICARCGITKPYRPGRTPYCRDCKPYAPKEAPENG